MNPVVRNGAGASNEALSRIAQVWPNLASPYVTCASLCCPLDSQVSGQRRWATRLSQRKRAHDRITSKRSALEPCAARAVACAGCGLLRHLGFYLRQAGARTRDAEAGAVWPALAMG